jgi:hypothetical protein
MGRINVRRVILGGLAAGLVINVFEGLLNGMLLSSQWGEVMKSLNRPATPSVKTLIAVNLWGFAVGLLMVWLYAAVRPRFGAGPRTAIIAGLVMWATCDALATAIPVFMHIYRVDLAVLAVGIEVVEMLAAGLVGAYLYKEDSAPHPLSTAARA